MANTPLFVSSAIFTLVHLTSIISNGYINMFYCLVMLRGCVSSLLNHGMTSELAEYYDRIVMIESFFVDIIYMLRTGTLLSAGVPMLLSIVLYGVSKICVLHDGNSPFTDILHICAHVCITICHMIILHSF